MSKRFLPIIMAAFILVFMAAVPALSQENADQDKPARGVVASLLYPGITVGPEDDVRVDLKVKNTGRSNETVLLEVTEKPEGWKARIMDFNAVVSGVFLTEDDDRTLTFTAEPEGEYDKLAPGRYDFKVVAKTPDGAFDQTSTLSVTVAAEQVVEEGVQLNTSYPVLRGPSDAKFEFSLDVSNESAEDALFNLTAEAPEGWEISFKPAYEQKQISSLQITGNQSAQVGVEVTPPRGAEVGDYPIKVKVSASVGKAEVDLTVALTGTYKIATGGIDGLVSVSTEKGKTAKIALYVKNEGSALQKELSLLSFKPENWKVEFKPEKLEDLKSQEIKQMEVEITPAEEALVGDYMVGVHVSGERSESEEEIRVTVKASSAWGWIGVGIIALVIIGLALTFRFLGRR